MEQWRPRAVDFTCFRYVHGKRPHTKRQFHRWPGIVAWHAAHWSGIDQRNKCGVVYQLKRTLRTNCCQAFNKMSLNLPRDHAWNSLILAREGSLLVAVNDEKRCGYGRKPWLCANYRIDHEKPRSFSPRQDYLRLRVCVHVSLMHRSHTVQALGWYSVAL